MRGPYPLLWVTWPSNMPKMVVTTAAALASLLTSVCRFEHVPYLDDVSFRRATLLSSLVNPDNTYSRLRVERYATNDLRDWDRLPEWNPPIRPVTEVDLDALGGAMSGTFDALELPRREAITSEADRTLVALGRVAFSRYPAQLAPELSVALSSREAAARYGLWIDPSRGVGGLVRVRMRDGSAALALTCSSCHAAFDGRAVEDGPPNTSLNLGAAILATDPAATESARSAALGAWGPGRLDVSTASGTEPVRIPDLRPVRYLTHLHHDATLAVRGLSTVAIRLETLIITSYGQVIRPPRLIALALAAYVDSLAKGLPPMGIAETVSPKGAAIFSLECSSCHSPPSFTGEPIPVAFVGTDPTLGGSAERGTGMYRVPSLRGCGSRKQLLHDGTVPSLDALFDPTRPTDDFPSRMHGSGAVPGHLFGLDLSGEDRAALLSYLNAL